MHPTSPDVSLFHSDCAAACAIGSCGLPNSRSRSFGLCATANEAPIDRSASAPNHLNKADLLLVSQPLWYKRQNTFQQIKYSIEFLLTWCAHRCRSKLRVDLSDDLDRTADRKTKLVVCAPAIDRDFAKPVSILIPEGRAEWTIAEGPRVLQPAACRGEHAVGRQDARPQPGHGIAEVIDVDDFGKVVRPVSSAIRVILA